MTAQSSQSYYRSIEVSRHGYPYPTLGNGDKLLKIWNKYPEEDDYLTDEGLQMLWKDLGIDGAHPLSLIVYAMTEQEEFGCVHKDEFINGLKKCGCSKIKDIINKAKTIYSEIDTKPKLAESYAMWLFNSLKEDKKCKSVGTEMLG